MLTSKLLYHLVFRNSRSQILLLTSDLFAIPRSTDLLLASKLPKHFVSIDSENPKFFARVQSPL